jgi:UDP-glucose 4-epimerase
MKVLVTGGLGMIGAFVVRELLEAGHMPVVLDRYDGPGAFGDIGSEVEQHAGDVLDIELVTQLLTGVDAVAHLAGMLPAEAAPYYGYGITAMGPVTTFEAARRAGVTRVVWASAKAVYGELAGAYGYPAYAPVPETHSRGVLAFSPVYCASKRLAEDAGCYYATTYGLEIIALRFSTIFGPGKIAPHGAALVGAIVHSAVGGSPVIVSQGADERDEIIYVRDAARGVLAALTSPAPTSWVFNIASGLLVSLPEVAQAVQATVGTVRASIGAGLDPFGIGPMYGRLDGTLAATQLGFEPVWGLEAAITDFAAALTGAS